MNSTNPWDELSDYFDTSKDEDDIPDGAADNILIAWPVIVQHIEQYRSHFSSNKALDYGCGTGGFAHKLTTLGFETTGIDNSTMMIQRAKKAYGSQVHFIVDDTSSFTTSQTFSLITSIMVLQFIENIEQAFTTLVSALDTNGLFIFAVHNPNYIHNSILKFENGVQAPIFIRNADFYHKLGKKHQLQNVLVSYPPFTEDFVQKYPEFADEKIPEYMILGYSKNRYES